MELDHKRIFEYIKEHKELFIFLVLMFVLLISYLTTR